MRLLDRLASAFIDVFGITQPSDAARRRASWYIFVLLVLSVLLCAGIGFLLFRAIHRQ